MDENSLAQFIDNHSKQVFFVGKDGCKYCDMLEADLKSMDIPFSKFKVGESVSQSIVDAIKTEYSHNTFPMLFFGESFVGGYSAFQQLCYTGQLQPRLEHELKITVNYDF